MSNCAMSNETGLDWLARNVHEWPAGEHQPWCYVYWKGGRRAVSGNCITVIQPCVRIEKSDWLARRAELQNKPSWDDFGESAKFMAQDSDGAWMAFENEPTTKSHVWSVMRGWCGYARDGSDRCRGEVLGDWRDTLEKRPEEFKPFASIEDNQEQDMAKQQEMKQDSGWFERGELPPVGAVCLYVISDRLSAEVEITAHAKFGLCFVEVGKSGENYVSKTAELHRFRPIRTERDVLLSVIVEEMNHYDTDGKLADAILAAGFSLRAK